MTDNTDIPMCKQWSVLWKSVEVTALNDDQKEEMCFKLHMVHLHIDYVE